MKYKVSIGYDRFGAPYLYVKRDGKRVALPELDRIAEYLESKLNTMADMARQINTLPWDERQSVLDDLGKGE